MIIVQILILFFTILLPQILCAHKQYCKTLNYKNDINYIQQSIKDHLIFAVGGYFMYEYINSPFKPIHEIHKNPNFISIGWLNYTPNAQAYFYNRFKTNEITPFMFEKDAHIISNQYTANFLAIHAKEKYNKHVEIKTLRYLDGPAGTIILKFINFP